jgi:ABC-type phosphate transport system substrate-binding protein
MNVRVVTTKITTRLLVLAITMSIFAGGLVSASELAYAYLKILSPTKGQKIPAGSVVNITGTSTPANATGESIVGYHRRELVNQ